MNLAFDNEMHNDLQTPKQKVIELGMTKQQYALALDNIVKVSVDVFVTNEENQVLLGQRKDWPVKGLWCFGGRMLPRELFRQSAKRSLGRELGLKEIDPSSIEMIGYYSFVWDKRKEEPINNGFHDIIIFMKYQIPKNTEMILDNTHEKIKWYNPEELRQIKDKIHPYLWRGMIDGGIL